MSTEKGNLSSNGGNHRGGQQLNSTSVSTTDCSTAERSCSLLHRSSAVSAPHLGLTEKKALILYYEPANWALLPLDLAVGPRLLSSIGMTTSGLNRSSECCILSPKEKDTVSADRRVNLCQQPRCQVSEPAISLKNGIPPVESIEDQVDCRDDSEVQWRRQLEILKSRCERGDTTHLIRTSGNDDSRPYTYTKEVSKTIESLLFGILHLHHSFHSFPQLQFSSEKDACDFRLCDILTQAQIAYTCTKQLQNILNQKFTHINETVNIQEARVRHLIHRIHCLEDENMCLASAKERMVNQISEMQAIVSANNNISQEKRKLEEKVGQLMWENATLHAKLQQRQRNDWRDAEATTKMRHILDEAEECVKNFKTKYDELQLLTNSLLATIGNLGYLSVMDLNGNKIKLDNIDGCPLLELEPGPNSKRRGGRRRPSDKWYKAMLASQEETIHRLQAEIRQLESNSKDPNVAELQRSLQFEIERSHSLEKQVIHFTRLLEQAAASESSLRGMLENERLQHNTLMEELWAREIQRQQQRQQQHQQIKQIRTDYERMGARPKTLFRTTIPNDSTSEQRGCSGNRNRTFTEPYSSTSTMNFVPSYCPFCREKFPDYALPAERHAHIHMHTYGD